MRKSSYFASQLRDDWPRPDEIAQYFIRPPEQRWFFDTRNDSGGFTLESTAAAAGLSGKEAGPVVIDLGMWGHRVLGLTLQWSRHGAGFRETYYSRGDVARLREYVCNFHGTLQSVGLFIPFDVAWPGVKEFLENDGRRPDSIDWIAGHALPPETFPDPGE